MSTQYDMETGAHVPSSDKVPRGSAPEHEDESEHDNALVRGIRWWPTPSIDAEMASSEIAKPSRCV
ncbi:hypothetical protein EON62_04500 [archaeon]|nr:MAG: hypothetical protein EON62_04500 [archaeon]